MRKTLLFGSIVLQALVPFASALNLQDNFQALTITVPSKCLQAYSQTIPGCTEADFGKTTTCSSACVAGLDLVAKSVDTACSNVVVDSSTLLGRVFQGEIVPSLCPNNGKSSSSSSSPPASTQKSTVVATSKQLSSSTTPAAAVSTTTEASSSVTSAVQSSSTSEASSSSSTTSEATTTNTPQGSAAVGSSTSTSSTTSSTSAAPAAGGRTGLTIQQQQLQAGSNSGGGSPFDIVGYTASANRLTENGVGLILTGIALLLVGFWM